MLLDSLFSITMWAAGVVFAAHALPYERSIAIKCAVAGLIGCIAYNLAWTPFAPHMILGIRSTVYFSYISVIVGAYCFEKSMSFWWGLPLFLLFVLDICCHITRTFNEVGYYPYSVAVDTIGYLQIAIFLCIGCDGVRNRIANIADYVRYGSNSHKAT